MKFTKSHLKSMSCVFLFLFCVFLENFRGRNTFTKNPPKTPTRSPSKTPSWLQKYCEVPSKGGTHDTLQDWPRKISDFARHPSRVSCWEITTKTQVWYCFLLGGGGWKCMVKVCIWWFLHPKPTNKRMRPGYHMWVKNKKHVDIPVGCIFLGIWISGDQKPCRLEVTISNLWVFGSLNLPTPKKRSQQAIADLPKVEDVYPHGKPWFLWWATVRFTVSCSAPGRKSEGSKNHRILIFPKIAGISPMFKVHSRLKCSDVWFCLPKCLWHFESVEIPFSNKKDVL